MRCHGIVFTGGYCNVYEMFATGLRKQTSKTSIVRKIKKPEAWESHTRISVRAQAEVGKIDVNSFFENVDPSFDITTTILSFLIPRSLVWSLFLTTRFPIYLTANNAREVHCK